jgi:hypothetical protein
VPFCPNGSEPKTGIGAYYTYDDSYIAAKFGIVAGWFTNWAMGLPATPQLTSDLCASDPPTELPTSADYPLLATPLIALATGTYRRFGNQIKAEKWKDLCQCKASSPATCATLDTGIVHLVRGTAIDTPFGVTTKPMSVTFTYTVTNYSGPGGGSMEFQVNSYDYPAYTVVQSVSSGVLATGNQSATVSGSLNQAHTGVRYYIARGGLPVGASCDVRVTATVTCAGSAGPPYTPPPVPTPPTGFPSPPAAPTCASYQDICAMMQAIANKLDYTRMELQLLQRWERPFAYNFGATHTGITGTGSFPITRLLGLQVVVTDFPAATMVLPGGTPYLWDMGWISVEGPEGMIEEKRLTRQAFTWLAEQMQLATSFKWSLADGVEMAISELLPEP